MATSGHGRLRAASGRGRHHGATTFTRLTPAEIGVLNELAQGRDTAEAADNLKISVGTFTGHVGSIGDKLHVSSRAAKVHAAIVAGAIPRPARVEPPKGVSPADVTLWRAVATRSRTQEIADAVGLSRASTREAIKDLMQRAGAQSEPHLVLLGHAFGIVTTDDAAKTASIAARSANGRK